MENYEIKFLKKIEKIISSCGTWQSYLKKSSHEIDSLLNWHVFKGIIGIFSETQFSEHFESENPILEIAEIEFSLSRKILNLELHVHTDEKNIWKKEIFYQVENSAINSYSDFQKHLRIVARNHNLGIE
jgi:hypothetical protein